MKNKIIITGFLIVTLLLYGCSTAINPLSQSLYSKIPSEQDDFSFPLPPVSPIEGRNIKLWATVYYVHPAQPLLKGDVGLPYYNAKGEVISDPVSLKEWCLGAMEGTIKIIYRKSPVILNYVSKSNNESRVDCVAIMKPSPKVESKWKNIGRSVFEKTSSDYGKGVSNMDLIPYRTIAADKVSQILKRGTVIFIKDARGVPIQLPNGVTVLHDGYFYVGDTGGEIKDKHIDVFCGITKSCLNVFAKSTPKYTFDAQIITDTIIIKRLNEIHDPGYK